jgi:hypothetical protein
MTQAALVPRVTMLLLQSGERNDKKKVRLSMPFKANESLG